MRFEGQEEGGAFRRLTHTTSCSRHIRWKKEQHRGDEHVRDSKLPSSLAPFHSQCRLNLVEEHLQGYKTTPMAQAEQRLSEANTSFPSSNSLPVGSHS